MRYFNGKPIELLAPAGNFEIFESVVESKCDAIYFGGQSLNMRMIRKGFNFSDEELEKAVHMAHEKGKKAYITVNNLVDFDEIELAKVYLKTLNRIHPDAIIIQDFAILELVKELKLSLEIHSSVMMNVHNIPMIQTLKKHGISRVVLSRESSLEDVRYFRSQAGMEIEYFTHGDMCIAHGAQCYYSSMLFGMSSNRGKCLKPCRWWFNLDNNHENNKGEDIKIEKDFPMAVKDLCLYSYLPEMISAGVTSFKIEGRMREKAFITELINLYGDALDRLIADPVGFDRNQNYDIIHENRKRDLSTAYAFGNPGVTNINTRYEGTGKFYSTGKMFSTPTEERSIHKAQTEKIKSSLSAIEAKQSKPLHLSVRVQTMDQARVAVEHQVARIYLAADVFLPQKPFSIVEIKSLKAQIESHFTSKTEVYVATPRMMNALQFDLYFPWLKEIKPYINGILVGNLGALNYFKNLELDMVGDYSLNVFNPLSAQFYAKEGLSQTTGSLELTAHHLKNLVNTQVQTELVVYGRVPAMYFDHDFHSALNQQNQNPVLLHNEAGRFEIYKDQHNRSHLMTNKTLNFLPILTELGQIGIHMVRIEGGLETPESLSDVIDQFKDAILCIEENREVQPSYSDKQLETFTYGALEF